MNNSDIIFNLLQIKKNVPLSEEKMAQSLTVTFHPPHKHSARLDAFVEAFKKNLIDLGVKVLSYEDALLDDGSRKVKPGVVIIEQGEGKNEALAIRKVSSLYDNPVVAIFDEAPPIPENPTLQETLDSIVGVLAWNLTHVPIFVEEDKWTICTMNGAVIECGDWRSPRYDILHSLVPKLSAQVVPPSREEIVYRERIFDPIQQGFGDYIDDFMSAAKVWHDNGLMLAHTSIEDLKYRNKLYKRIVSKYLDHRTGMSYGFMVKQLPTPIETAIERESAPSALNGSHWNNQNTLTLDGETYLLVELFNKEWIVKIPDVWLLSTRSGCNKTNLNPDKDILKLGLHNGEITIDTPSSLSKEECRPSYDTYAILAHAVGNVITASILRNVAPDSEFPDCLENDGLSVSHWHGYPDKSFPLDGYAHHGEENPPVSCSTPQSAAYAFTGKLKALSNYKNNLDQYRGDIHVEPHHGTNITGCLSITETAKYVDEMHKHSQVTEHTEE
jgi:hypothetical protein